jgi:hypothetical protein
VIALQLRAASQPFTSKGSQRQHSVARKGKPHPGNVEPRDNLEWLSDPDVANTLYRFDLHFLRISTVFSSLKWASY